MHSIPGTCVTMAGLLAFCSLPAMANKPEHVPANAPCGDIYYSAEYEPASIDSLDELTPEARGKLRAYLDEYLGPDHAKKVKLEGGQLLDRQELLAKVPESVDFKWKAPKYNLFLDLPVAGTIHGFCGSVALDDDGTVLTPISFPRLREHPERGKIVSAREASRAAEHNGVPVDKATKELLYFPDSDTIEYDFAYVSKEEGATVEYTHLHVMANDVTQVHWSKSIETR